MRKTENTALLRKGVGGGGGETETQEESSMIIKSSDTQHGLRLHPVLAGGF